MPAHSSAPANSTDKLPSADVRGWLSLLLFIHLFCVTIALASYTFPSALEERLRTVLAPYLVTLNFDLNPNFFPAGRFYLTHDTPYDVDFLVEVESQFSDGTAATTTIPLGNLWPPERGRRYQALANATGSMIGNETIEAILPRALAGSIIRAAGATKGLVRIKGHLPLPMENVEAADPAQRDPFAARYYNTVYEAHVLVSPSGQVDLVKKSAAGEVAPVERGGK